MEDGHQSEIVYDKAQRPSNSEHVSEQTSDDLELQGTTSMKSEDAHICAAQYPNALARTWQRTHRGESAAFAAVFAALLVLGCLVCSMVFEPWSNGQSLSQWKVELGDPNAVKRASAVAALGGIGTLAQSAVSALQNMLHQDTCAEVRVACTSALANIGPAREVIVPLTDALQHDSSDKVRAASASALASIGPAKDAVLLLKNALHDEAESVRRAAAQGLGKMGTEARSAVPVLAQMLKETAPDCSSQPVACNAAKALAEIGPAADAALPDLVAALKSKNKSVRCDVVIALGRIGPATRALPALLAALHDSDVSVREQAAYAISWFGPEAKMAVKELITLNDWETSVRCAAIHALAKIGPPETILPYLIKRLQDWPAAIRIAASEELGQFGARSKDAVPSLITAFQDKYTDSMGRQLGDIFAGLFLGRVPPDRDRIRETIAWTLGKIGPNAQAAVPALTSALKDDCGDTRYAAAMALLRIQGSVPPGTDLTKPDHAFHCGGDLSGLGDAVFTTFVAPPVIIVVLVLAWYLTRTLRRTTPGLILRLIGWALVVATIESVAIIGIVTTQAMRLRPEDRLIHWASNATVTTLLLGVLAGIIAVVINRKSAKSEPDTQAAAIAP